MMGHKHLHELLSEDQEPFQLKNYIADRRCQLKSATDGGKTALQLRKRKTIVDSTSSSTTARSLCINPLCLFSFHDSPDIRKSPFLDFSSPTAKSPCNSKSPTNATVFLHIPARTAAMLLDAAMRIQKQSTSSKKKPESKTIGFGLLGSFLRRLKDRSSKTKRREIGSVKSTSLNLACETLRTKRSRRKEGVVNDVVGAVDIKWSEKSSELETSCSSRSIHDSAGIEFASCEKCFCSSPSSPFHFSLQKSPSRGRRTPEFSSPVTSPSRHFQEKEIHETDGSQDGHVEEQEEKEQCSPVSVLDTPFEDEEEDDDGGADVEGEEGDRFDLECSYVSVERTKKQLLQKLRRFEMLAELDPVELEKHMLEDYHEDDNLVLESPEDEKITEEHLEEIFSYLGVPKLAPHMKRLVSDLVAEENKNEEEREVVVKRVCRRLESWKMVESNTIDMMVELDFRREGSEGWKRYDLEKIRETGMDIEFGIFGFLMEELAQELVASSGCELV